MEARGETSETGKEGKGGKKEWLFHITGVDRYRNNFYRQARLLSKRYEKEIKIKVIPKKKESGEGETMKISSISKILTNYDLAF